MREGEKGRRGRLRRRNRSYCFHFFTLIWKYSTAGIQSSKAFGKCLEFTETAARGSMSCAERRHEASSCCRTCCFRCCAVCCVVWCVFAAVCCFGFCFSDPSIASFFFFVAV